MCVDGAGSGIEMRSCHLCQAAEWSRCVQKPLTNVSYRIPCSRAKLRDDAHASSQTRADDRRASVPSRHFPVCWQQHSRLQSSLQQARVVCRISVVPDVEDRFDKSR